MFITKYDALLNELEAQLSNIIKAAGSVQEDNTTVLDISKYRFMFNNTFCPKIALDEQGSLFFVHKVGSYHIWGCKNLKTLCELVDKLMRKHFFIFTYDGNDNANYDIIINHDNVKVFFGDHSECFDQEKEYFSKGDKVFEMVAGEDHVRDMVEDMNVCVYKWVTSGKDEIMLGYLMKGGVLLSSEKYTGTKFEVDKYKEDPDWVK